MVESFPVPDAPCAGATIRSRAAGLTAGTKVPTSALQWQAEGPVVEVTATLTIQELPVHAFRMRGRDALQQRAPVIVGVDGSIMATQAADLGAWEATRRHTSLLLVHAYLDHMPSADGGWPSRQPLTHMVGIEARALLDDIELRTHSRNRALRIRSTLVAGAGAGTLVELSRMAALVVVGSRGADGFIGLRLGSVATQVALYAHAPVTVVRAADRPSAPNAPVVVGVDGSPSSDATLAYAFEQAAARHVPLTAVCVWWMLARDDRGPTNLGAYEPVVTRERVRHVLAEALAGWRSKYPETEVQERPLRGISPAWALIEAGREAGLLVVGCRGRSGRLLPGSTSQTVVAYADCPVAIVR
jgi:nucleotide-binding universal stress UspA family protein